MSKAKTPGSIFSAAIIMFVYGGLLLFCGVCGSASSLLQDEKTKAMQAEMEKAAPALTVVSIASNASYLLIGVLFIVAGLGVLRLNKASRILAYVCCAVILLMTISSSIYTAIFVFPVQQRLIMEEMQKNNPPMPFDMNKLMTASMAFGLLVAIGVPLLFCVPILILLNVKTARDAFAGVSPEPDEEDPYAIRRKPRREEDDDGYSDEYESGKPPRSPGDTGITDKGQ